VHYVRVRLPKATEIEEATKEEIEKYSKKAKCNQEANYHKEKAKAFP